MAGIEWDHVRSDSEWEKRLRKYLLQITQGRRGGKFLEEEAEWLLEHMSKATRG